MEQTGAGPEGVAALRLRRAGRVIVLDPEDRVLLFRYDDELPNGRHWCTPGWTDVPLGDEVHERTLTMKYADEIVRQHERFFLGRVELAQRGLGEVTAMHTSDGIAAWHWWTLAEMDTTTEVIWPPGLADLIRGLLGQSPGSWT